MSKYWINVLNSSKIGNLRAIIILELNIDGRSIQTFNKLNQLRADIVKYRHSI